MLPLAFLATMLGLAILEHYTFALERAGGWYLNWRNSGREAWGTFWEEETRERAASRRMDEETAEASRLKRQAELVGTFAELLDILPDDVGVTVTPSKVVDLYQDLPPALRNSLISERELSELYWSGKWQRSSVWRKAEGCRIYLIDNRNRMIRNFYVSIAFLHAVSSFGRTIDGRLDDMPAFGGFTYEGDLFLEVYFKLTESTRKKILPDPEILLSIPRPLLQVGLSPPDTEGTYGQIAFESMGETGSIVTTYPVEPDGMNRLIFELEWDKPDSISTGQRSTPGKPSGREFNPRGEIP